MEKKIAILTFHQANNYGAVLQNFALQKAISKFCIPCVTIDYDDKNIKEVYKIKIFSTTYPGIHKITGNISNFINYWQANKQKKRFEEFRTDYLELTEELNKTALYKIDGKYSVFLCGSDQIWNSGLTTRNEIETYTLGFVKKSKKAAYAASAGGTKYLTEQTFCNIKQLDYITVREKDLRDYLAEKIEKNISVVCDPVFLLEKKEWNEIIKNIKSRKEKFVFLYWVGHKREETCDVASYIAKKNKWKIFFPAKRGINMLFNGKCIFEDGPLEFLSDIANSQFVVASSFHAVAFAIIFEKEFVTILHPTTGSRVIDLLETLGLSERIVEDKQDYIRKSKNWKAIDYTEVKRKLADIQKESYIHLENICKLAESK